MKQKKDILKGLQPERVWHWFGEIMRIPRSSKHEERISAYLVKRAIIENTEQLREQLIRKISIALGKYANELFALIFNKQHCIVDNLTEAVHRVSVFVNETC